MATLECGENNEMQEENGVLFYINKDGFPVSHYTMDRMWRHVAKTHPDGENMTEKIQNAQNLPKVQIPNAPVHCPSMSIPEKIEAIQNYMNELQYNHTGTQFFEIRKNRPLAGLMESAKEMIKESLPIKCLEAVILALHLSSGMQPLDRFPISFKTQFAGKVHHHVVLGVAYAGRYGALGMSRREDLMYKPLTFKTLSDLIFDFQESYKDCFHTVRKVKVGLPVSHDQHSYEKICWKMLSLNVIKLSREEARREIDRFSREMRGKFRTFSPVKMAASSPRKELGLPGSSSPRKTAVKQSQQLSSDEEEEEGIANLATSLKEYQIRV